MHKLITDIKNAVYLQRFYASGDNGDGKASKDKKYQVDVKLTPKIVRDCKPEESIPCKTSTKTQVCDHQVVPLIINIIATYVVLNK